MCIILYFWCNKRYPNNFGQKKFFFHQNLLWFICNGLIKWVKLTKTNIHIRIIFLNNCITCKSISKYVRTCNVKKHIKYKKNFGKRSWQNWFKLHNIMIRTNFLFKTTNYWVTYPYWVRQRRTIYAPIKQRTCKINDWGSISKLPSNEKL